jgi:anti-sigma factor RsiW
VRALQPGHLEDVISTDQHTVKPWFDGRIDFAPPVKDLAAKQFPLLGGRLDYVNDRPVAALVYGSDKHVIDLYIWPTGKAGATGAPATQTAARNGYNTVHWSDNGMDFWAVSDLEAGKLRDFVRDWRAVG